MTGYLRPFVMLTLTFLSFNVQNISSDRGKIERCIYSCGQDVSCKLQCEMFSHGSQLSDTNTKEKDGIVLVCREVHALAIKWHISTKSNSLPFLEIRAEFVQEWKHVNLTKNPLHRLDNLLANTLYFFRLSINSKGGSVRLKPESFKTLKQDTIPSAVSKFRVTEIILKERLVSVIINWIPNKELTCNYKILLWVPATTELHQFSPKIEELYEMELSHLQFSTNYSVSISAFSESEDSPKVWSNFTTPSCLKLNNYNLTTCVPEKPTGINITESGEEDCTVEVSWDRPRVQPDYYLVKVQNSNLFYNYTVPGNLNKIVANLIGLKKYYRVIISASARSGKSPETIVNHKNSCFQDNSLLPMASHRIELGNSMKTGNVLMINAIIITILLMIASLVTYTVWLKKKKWRNTPVTAKEEEISKIQTAKSDEPNEQKEEDKVDEEGNEIKVNNLELKEIIGEGEFGVVRKAVLISKSGETMEVAVKMLRENNNIEDESLLEKEMAVMKSVGKHRNIVSLLGCNSVPKMLIVELCSLGDLQNYLRQGYVLKAWKTISTAQRELEDSNIRLSHNFKSSSSSYYELYKDMSGNNVVSNKLYEKTELERKHLDLKMVDLLSFARQIAVGMEYLSENHVIHRDLAARNVLLCEDMTVKISDFGLSRDVYEQNIYWKKASARLPIKWMAVESLLHQIFTSQSDVWSFGVLLWEIMTLGGCPYPSIHSRQIFRLLEEGYRMEKPPICSQELYNIMLSCWDTLPHNRPSFGLLVRRLEGIMRSESPNQYLDLNKIPNEYRKVFEEYSNEE